MPPCVVTWAARDLWRPLGICQMSGALPMFERMATAAITAALVTATTPRTASATSTASTTGSVVTSLASPHARAVRPARRCAAVSLALALATACLAEDATRPVVPPPPPPPATKVVQLVVEPATTSLVPGETQRFTAYGLTSDGGHVDGPVAWSAGGGTITPDGVFTADTAPGSFSITARSNAWGLAGTASVRVLSRRRVTSVAVRPDTATLPIEGSWPFQAILRDSAGDSLSGRAVSWTSGDSRVAVVDSTGLVTGVAAGTATITAVSEGRSGEAVITVVPSGAGPWAHEPSGFAVITDWGFDQPPVYSSAESPIPGTGGWKVIFSSPPGSAQGWAQLISDPSAPFSPASVYDFVYPQGMVEGTAPATVYYPTLSSNEVYVGFWWKPSSPFDLGPNGNKIAFLFNGGGTGGGQMFMILKGDLRLHVLSEYPGDFRWRDPNINSTAVTLGAWHRIEWYGQLSTGTMKWWLDGVLQGSYSDVHTTSAFNMFQFSPTWGGNSGARKAETDHYWFDHVHISVP